jgi:hypothetical protein
VLARVPACPYNGRFGDERHRDACCAFIGAGRLRWTPLAATTRVPGVLAARRPLGRSWGSLVLGRRRVLGAGAGLARAGGVGLGSSFSPVLSRLSFLRRSPRLYALALGERLAGRPLQVGAPGMPGGKDTADDTGGDDGSHR